ncbi:MAG TPA: hypothetical protein VMS45_08840, partial [Gemmatimonadaceae bacterium]|nr:hypothetical protein [Gemmatimonadaceae bacterium]
MNERRDTVMLGGVDRRRPVFDARDSALKDALRGARLAHAMQEKRKQVFARRRRGRALLRPAARVRGLPLSQFRHDLPNDH